MVEVTCLVLLGAALVIMCLFVFLDGELSKRFGGKMLFFTALLFIVFSLAFEPKGFIRWDLIEHFSLLEDMRYGGVQYATNESQYAGLYVYNYFAYFISLLPLEFQNLLSTIPLIIDFAIVGYIYSKMYKVYLPDANGKTRLLSMMLWLFTFGMKLAISGIRCSLAVSIVALAIFLEMIQKRRRLLSIFLYLIAIFIHNFAIIIILVRLVAMIKKPFLVMLISLGLSFALKPFANFVVENVRNEYISFSFKRILETVDELNFMYAIRNFNRSTMLIYLFFIALSVYLFVISMKAKEAYKENGYCKSVANFAATVGAVAIGLSFNYLYLERFMYLISFALLLITPIHNKNKNGINAENVVVIPMTLFLFFFNDIYLFMVNYTGRYFLSI